MSAPHGPERPEGPGHAPTGGEAGTPSEADALRGQIQELIAQRGESNPSTIESRIIDLQGRLIDTLAAELGSQGDRITALEQRLAQRAPRVPERDITGAGGGGRGRDGGNGGRGHGDDGERRRRWTGQRIAAAAVVGALAIGSIFAFASSSKKGSESARTGTVAAHTAKNPNVRAHHSFTREVVQLNEDGKSIPQELQAIKAHPDRYKVPISHPHDAQAELYLHHPTTKELATGSAIAAISDNGYRMSYANELQGVDAATPRSDSAQDQMSVIWRGLLDPKTTFEMTTLDGPSTNHGTTPADQVFDESMDIHHVPALRITPGEATGLHAVNIKAGGGQDGTIESCLNFVNKEGKVVKVFLTMPGRTPEKSPHRHRKHHKHHHGHPGKPNHPKQTPSTGGTPPTPPTPQKPLPAKVDEKTPGPNPASQSLEVAYGRQEASKPVPTQESTAPTSTTTQAEAPTIPEDNTPTATEPNAPVNQGTSNGEQTIQDQNTSTSTQSDGNGGTQGQGGQVTGQPPVGVGNLNGSSS